MHEKPVIVVQLVHIAGPLKGKVEESTDPVIRIGRHPDCQIRFPKDLTLISRNHAEIVREGNRFKLVDHSTNGSFVNGKAVKETFLKNGDVLTIGEGGPKISFLTEIKEAGVEYSVPSLGTPDKDASAFSLKPPVTPLPASAPEDHIKVQTPDRPSPPFPKQSLLSKVSAEQMPSRIAEPPRRPDPAEARIQAPLTIQLGPTIQSFKMLPVVVGKKDDCNFIINHADIIDRHIQIFFYENNYWVKDLTGQGLVTINDLPVSSQTPLHPGSHLSLGPRGPVFQFLSGGRLAEVAGRPMEEDSRKPLEKANAAWPGVPEFKRRGHGLLFFLIGLFVIVVSIVVWQVFFNTSASDGGTAGVLKEWWNRLMIVIQRIVG